VVSIEPASNVRYTTAHLQGEVDPEDHETFYHFEYVTQAQFEASEWAEASFAGFGSLPEGIGATPVQEDLSGLHPGATYHLRLVAENTEAQQAEAIAPSFETEEVAVPVVSIEEATSVSAETAHFSGTVEVEANPDPAFSASCRFDYISQQAWEAHGESFEGADSVPCEPNPVSGSEAQPVTVSAQAMNLKPNTTYHLRIVAENAGGTEAAPAPSFTTSTVKPEVLTWSNTPESESQVLLRGSVDPRNSAITDCHFDWGPASGGFEESAPCEPSPDHLATNDVQLVRVAASGGQFRLKLDGQATADVPFDATDSEIQAALELLPNIGAGNVSVSPNLAEVSSQESHVVTFVGALAGRQVDQLTYEDGAIPLSGEVAFNTELVGGRLDTSVPVTTKITGLEAGHDYHYKLVAVNAGGAAETEEAPFAPFEAPKEGACPNEVRRTEQHSSFLPECRAYEMASPTQKLGGDVTPEVSQTRSAVDGEAVQFSSRQAFGDAAGGGIAAYYIARRTAATPTGWATHSIMPAGLDPNAFHTLASNSTYQGDFSPDLSRGVFRTLTPLTPGEPNTELVNNLYLREGLLSGSGSDRLLTPCPVCSENHEQSITVAATSGTYTLSFLSQTTEPIPYNAPANHEGCPESEPDCINVQGALEALPTIGKENVSVVGGPGDAKGSKPYYLAFNNSLAEAAQPLLGADGSGLGGGTVSVASATVLADPFGGQFYHVKEADATPDLGQILFEAQRNLTADSPPQSRSFCSHLSPLPTELQFFSCQFRLYEDDHGTLRLAGRIPPPGEIECDDAGGTPCHGAPLSVAGLGALSFRTDDTISEDGSKVFFTARKSLFQFGGQPVGDLYMRVDHTHTVWLNASENPGAEPEHEPAVFRAISGDGSRVFFEDREQLTETPCDGFYLYDTTKPAADPHNLSCFFRDEKPGDSPHFVGAMGFSRDGSWLYFYTDAHVILPGQPEPLRGASVSIYSWHDGAVSFVGSIDSASAGQFGSWGEYGLTLRSRVSPDGHTLLFESEVGTGLTGYEHGQCADGPGGRCAEFYLYHADTHSLVCASCNPSGAPATSSASFFNESGSPNSSHLSNSLSSNGRFVFFDTGERLVPEDTNGARDVYSYDAETGAVHLLSSGTASSNSYFLEATPDGSNVFFTTAQPLLGWDVDTNEDLYDARVAGGFPEPPPRVGTCEGDTCRQLQPPPAADSPQSPTFAGPGNPRPKHPRHPKRHRKHGRRHHHRAANDVRGGNR
jgi:hypothetical protein